MRNYKTFKAFVGPEVMALVYGSIATGFFVFLTEAAFLLTIQGFLFSLGILNAAHLPPWYPKSIFANSLILTALGVCRALAYFGKTLFTLNGFHIYIKVQRKRLLELSLDHAFEISSHEAIGLFSEVTSRGGNAITALLTFLLTAVSSFFLLCLGLKLAPLEMVVGIILLGILALPLKKYDSLISKTAEGLRSEWVTLSNTLLEGIKNNFFLTVYGLIEREKRKGLESLDRYYNHHSEYTFSYAVRYALPMALGIMIISFVTFFSTKYLQTNAITLLGFFYLFVRFVQSFSEMYSGLGEVKLMSGSIWQLQEWEENLKNRIHTKKLRSHLLSDSKIDQNFGEDGISISLKDISFKYPNSEKWIIENLSFAIKQGDCLVISGDSGSGKSTLLSLILGVQEPSNGSISVNSKPVDEIRNQLFKHIGYVGPEPYLVTGTIIDNLLYGHSNTASVTTEDMYKALTAAKAKDFVDELPDGLTTVLGEYAKISTGQKQRLSIARSLLRNPKVLILDECTANLDAQNESEIAVALEALKSKITMIIVTHRPRLKSLASQTIDL